MKTNNTTKKAQGLPLNTIVIAILVIIVLLVIIVFFTTRVGETGDQLDQQSASACATNNPAISTAYPGATNDDLTSRDSCNNNEERVPGSGEDLQLWCIAAEDGNTEPTDSCDDTTNEEQTSPN